MDKLVTLSSEKQLQSTNIDTIIERKETLKKKKQQQTNTEVVNIFFIGMLFFTPHHQLYNTLFIKK